MPVNVQGLSFNSFGISCHQKKSFWGECDEVVKCSMGQRRISFSVQKVSDNILSLVTRQSTKDIDGWIKDEQKVYPSRVVNQEIDKFCLENRRNITNNDRKRVFAIISKHYGLELDSGAAQSSINHMIIGNGSFGKKMDNLCEGMTRNVKNHTSDYMANLLADKFYEKHIEPDVDITRLRGMIPRYMRYAISL
ncbi:bfpT-regulated chaperone [Citrobacter rodentium]|jgi:IpaB/EvcA family.|uniref:T3SS effector protein EspM3 n=2 Tax=Citrobacter rodentium TaxID=67825 RepID=D2TM85_CITRI|nr:bfpT-regulated chaperone [Citrobacter rodentium]KIQ53045.1 bfpT-regulated chaperone [Citrobacter rodentium]QBY29591.1 bfpT-regulated chaperone [Citrobacter rodentium]UHO33015.1 bfpT-regulated chaperone [Citrobacter rodentium NBRC 105723 = DSM 16636]CAP45399.1 EspM3 protein [Citrobacter rodentium ICC168]CBG89902.1 T3SS effector protein EspM3 [Citrobacter rodentium ICC168]